MKKLIALFLLIAMILGSTACHKNKDSENNSDNTNTESDAQQNPSDIIKETIVVPEYKDYGRGSVNFSEIVYSRPNLESVITSFEATTNTVKENEKSLSDQISDIRALENALSNVKTMYSLAEIYHHKNNADEYWQGEYEYISTNYPRLSQTVEDLLVACATSIHKEGFETDYFEYSLDEYVDGGIYTDEVVSLMEQEAKLETDYSSFNTSNVRISYKRTGMDSAWEGTVDEVLAIAKEYFENNEEEYEKVSSTIINELYQKALWELQKPVYVELIKVRRLIADELEYDSYIEVAYDSMGYDYSADEMLELLSNIGEYVSPIATSLEYSAFNYLHTVPQPTVSKTVLINTLYNVYKDLGGNYIDAYSYMLQHGLYDIESEQNNRLDGAFTTYLYDNASPYLFMTSSGFIRDYNTLSHEFGHFLDGYINDGNDASLTVSEISSQALELLTLIKLQGKLKSDKYQYLEYYTMYTFLNNVIIGQSFYAAFEHLAYQLSYDEINETRLTSLVTEAFELIYGDDVEIYGNLAYVLIPHTVLYPCYVESYVTSGLVSLDIFFTENSRTGKSGDGFALYEKLIDRDDDGLSFSEALETVGIDSPFEQDKAKEVANNIYYLITGKAYYTISKNEINAA